MTIMPAFDPAEARIRFSVPHGATIAEILRIGMSAMPPAERIRVDLVSDRGVCFVDRAVWRHVRPHAGVHVVVRVIPGGSSMRSVLSLMVSVAAAALAGPVAGLLNVTSAFGKAVIGAGLMMAGGLLLNALFPQQGEKKEKPNYVISGWQNEFSPDSQVPLVLGKVRYAPRYAARTYTEVVGDRLYLRTIFLEGYGPVVRSEPRIGRTDLSKFDEIEEETPTGLPEDPPLTLYATQVLEESIGTELVRERERDDYGEFVGPFVEKPISRFTARDATAATIILIFENGLNRRDGDKVKSRALDLKFEMRLVGEEEYTYLGTLTPNEKKTVPFFRAVTFDHPVRGHYEYRITRTSDNSDDANISDKVKWFALQSHRPEYPINFPRPLALRAMRVRATDQLNGTLDTFNEVLSSPARDWDGAAWVARETRNPAALAVHVLTGHWCPKPAADGEIDWPVFEEWHEECTEKNLAFNRVIDFDAGLDEVLAMVGAAGRGAVWWDGEKWTVTMDRKRTFVVDHISTRNASNIRWSTTYFEPPDGHRVTFLDETNDYEEGERVVPWPADVRYETKADMLADLSPRHKARAEVYADPVEANNAYYRKDGRSGEGSWQDAPLDVVEATDLPGVTNPDQIWLEMRRLQYERMYRNTVYTATQPGSVRRAAPGDMVMLARDVLVRAMHAGRVTAVAGRRIEVDAIFVMEEGQDYAIRWRRYTGDDDTVGESILRQIKTIAGENRAVTLVGTGEVPGVGDLIHFGPMAQESIPVIVAGIDRGEDNASILQMLPAADEMHDRLAAEVPPPWNGRVGTDLGGSSAPPAVPVVVEVATGVTGTDDPDGLVIRLRPGGGAVEVREFEVRHRLDGAGSWSGTVSVLAGAGAVSIPGYAAGDTVEWEPRAISVNNIPSAWGTTRETTIGADDPVAPDALNSDLIVVTGGLGKGDIFFTIPGDTENITHVQLYHNVTGVLDAGTDAVLAPVAVEAGGSYARVHGDASRASLLANGDFAAAAPPPTLGTGWTVAGGKANRAAGTAGAIAWTGLGLSAGKTYRFGLTVDSLSGSGASLTPSLTGGAGVAGSAITTPGASLGALTAVSGSAGFSIAANAAAVAEIDNVSLYEASAASLPQGTNYFWLQPVNDGVAGPVSGPFAVIVI
ncbi:hypothetical protein [Shinella sp. BYT-45]|uniref:TipJ family phage tail tip protein n=1 Tax=Shinella sp. BYT-45 TaxID=3377377 RepID=UPI00397F7D82